MYLTKGIKHIEEENIKKIWSKKLEGVLYKVLDFIANLKAPGRRRNENGRSKNANILRDRKTEGWFDNDNVSLNTENKRW